MVFFPRNGVFGSRVPRVFSVPGLGCFQFPDSGLMFQEWCVGRPWVFSVPRTVFPVPGQRGRHGGVCGSRAVFRVPACVPPLLRCFFIASCCFSAFLCFLASFLPPFLISSASALLPVFFLSFPPFLPSPFLPCLLLPFL